MSKKRKTTHDSKSFAVGALIGAIAGGIVGILTTPKTESHNRTELAKAGKRRLAQPAKTASQQKNAPRKKAAPRKKTAPKRK